VNICVAGFCWCIRKSFILGLFVVVLLFLSSAAFLQYLPQLVSQYQEPIVQFASKSVGQPITLKEIRVESSWHTPRFIIEDLVIHNEETLAVPVRVQSVKVDLLLWESLFSGRLKVGMITLDGVNLTLIQDQKYRLTIQDWGSEEVSEKGLESSSVAGVLPLVWQRLQVKNSRLGWKNLQSGKHFILSEVNIDGKRQNNEMDVSGGGVLVRSSGEAGVLFTGVMGLEKSSFAVRLDSVPWQALGLSQFTRSGLSVQNADLEAAVRTELVRNKIVGLDGEFAAKKVRVGRVGSTSHADSTVVKLVSGNIHWRPEEAGWKLNLDNFQWEGKTRWPQSSVVVRKYGPDQENISIQVAFARIDDLVPLLQHSNILTAQQQQLLLKTSPWGVLREVTLSLNRQDSTLTASSHFSHVGWNAWEHIPAVSGLSGQVNLYPEQLQWQISSQELLLDMPKVFGAELGLSQLLAHGVWDFNRRQIDISELQLYWQGLFLDGLLSLNFAQPSSLIDLNLQFQHSGNIPHLAVFLPDKVISSKLKSWLTSAITQTSIPNGELRLKGALTDFPFTDNSGVFSVHADVRGGHLRYLPDWPSISAIHGQLDVRGPSMNIHINRANSRQLAIRDVDVTLRDMRQVPSKILISGYVDGDLELAKEFIDHSPLASKLSEPLSVLGAGGVSKLNLALDIPLNAPKNVPVGVAGRLFLDGNRMHLSAAELDISGIYGVLNFNREGLENSALEASVYGEKALVNIRSSQQDEGVMTHIQVDTRLSADLLSTRYSSGLLSYLSGSSLLRVQVNVGKSQPLRISLSSDLVGLGVNFPAPMTKAAEDQAPLWLEITKKPQVFTVNGHYGDELKGVFQNTEGKPWKAAVQLGEQAVVLPNKSQLLVAGELSEFSVDEWVKLRHLYTSSPNSSSTALNMQADLAVSELEAGGRLWQDVTVSIKKQDHQLTADFLSRETSGRVETSLHDDGPVVVQLDKLVLLTSPESEEVSAAVTEQTASSASLLSDFDPASIPAIHLQCDHLQINDISMGKVSLEIEPAKDRALRLKRLEITSPHVNIHSEGVWLAPQNGQQKTRFKVTLSGGNLKDILSQFGYQSSFRKGRSEFVAQGSWFGGPADFSLKNVEANLNVHVGKGRLRDIDPGLGGKLFGLFGMQSLVRRASLDFLKGALKSGLLYQKITGDFQLKDGIAHTDNFLLQSDTVYLGLFGDTDLINRRYDQQVVVSPQIEDSVMSTSLFLAAASMLGAVAPPVALGTLGVAALFKESDVDDVVEKHYHLVGDWDTAELVLVKD